VRDPQSNLLIESGKVLRQLSEDLAHSHPLKSVEAHRWVAEGLLIPFDWLDPLRLASPRVAFVSSPEEWCDAQLFVAAELTLDLLESANEVGADLKDASAWNVILMGANRSFVI